jgi:hypothetical protein
MPRKRSPNAVRRPHAIRLEHVRERSGYKSLRDYWKAIIAGDAYDVTYESVRKYHLDRLPPADYLKRVYEVTGADPGYLLGVKGAETPFPDTDEATAPEPAEPRKRYATHDSPKGLIKAQIMDNAEVPEPFKQIFNRLSHLTAVINGDLRRREVLPADETYSPSRTGFAAFELVKEAALRPLENYPIDVWDLRHWQVRQYATGIESALYALIPDLGSYYPTYREHREMYGPEQPMWPDVEVRERPKKDPDAAHPHEGDFQPEE